MVLNWDSTVQVKNGLFDSTIIYTIMIKHPLSIYTSMKHSLISLKLLALALNSLDTLSDVRIKAIMLLF